MALATFVGARSVFVGVATVPLSRHIFKAPTRFYKTGVVFMAYLNGHQDHFTMIGGQESARSLQHLAELFRLWIRRSKGPAETTAFSLFTSATGWCRRRICCSTAA